MPPALQKSKEKQGDVKRTEMDFKVLRKQLETHESIELYLYDDATGMPLKPGTVLIGHPTIGVGRCLDTKGISKEESDQMLRNDIDEVVSDLKDLFSPEFWDELPNNIQLVLADMRFNLGPDGFRAFGNMIEAVKNRNWKKMKEEMYDSSWADQVATRADNLARLVQEVIDNE